jgi:hypothetical protein
MNKVVSFAASGLLAFAAFFATSGEASAQTSSVALDCNGSDLCVVDVNSPGSPAPFHIAWFFDNTAGAIFPANCTNRYYCTFYCPNQSKLITASVTVADANNQFIGSATARAHCTPEPL